MAGKGGAEKKAADVAKRLLEKRKVLRKEKKIYPGFQALSA